MIINRFKKNIFLNLMNYNVLRNLGETDDDFIKNLPFSIKKDIYQITEND